MSIIGTGKVALTPDVSGVTGPFFLGFMAEAFGMGIVLVLSINYFAILSHPKPPGESSRRLGVSLVAVSLVLNLAQTIVDGFRGWEMFAIHFLDLSALLHPGSTWFISPFLGLLPALITQLFLLRRSILFISSLSIFWPRLAHPLTRWIFGLVMGGLIGLGAICGTLAGAWVWKSQGLWALRRDGTVKTPFQESELGWLVTSAGVDVILSLVLTIELWWARRQLAQNGVMREVVTRLMLVTFNGGVAVTVLQIAVLFLYQFASSSAWCYLPVLSLPKVYTITLILSLSLRHHSGSSPSQVFSLPTIFTRHDEGNLQNQGQGQPSPSRPSRGPQSSSSPDSSLRRSHSPAVPRESTTNPGDSRRAESSKIKTLSRSRSRGWLSRKGGLMKKEAGPSGAEPRYAGHRMDHDGQNEKGDHLEREKGKDKDKDIVGSRDGSQRLARLSAAVVRGWRSSQGWIGWSLVGSVRSQERRGVKEVGGDGGICWKEPDLPIPPFIDVRRPSEPNSLAPLLPHPPHDGDERGVGAYPCLYPRSSVTTGDEGSNPPCRGVSPLGPSSHTPPYAQPHATPHALDGRDGPSTTGCLSPSAIPAARCRGSDGHSGRVITPRPTIERRLGTDGLFENTDPFATSRRCPHPARSPSDSGILAGGGETGGGETGVGVENQREEGEEREEGLRRDRGNTRLMSFEDMFQ